MALPCSTRFISTGVLYSAYEFESYNYEGNSVNEFIEVRAYDTNNNYVTIYRNYNFKKIMQQVLKEIGTSSLYITDNFGVWYYTPNIPDNDITVINNIISNTLDNILRSDKNASLLLQDALDQNKSIKVFISNLVKIGNPTITNFKDTSLTKYMPGIHRPW